MNYSIGPKYGKALLKIANATQQVDAIQQQLSLFIDLLTKNPLLEKTLLSPMFSLSQREELLHGVTVRLSLSPLLS
ncbi:MAG: F0F1 ATP synthase subunit delta, partial [Deltaproteobacteria bacterium]|nr:F0F1 ATP synthase subunit delta [Deltaproteobacteria bacterium]